MKITRIDDNTFEFECEGEDEAREVENLKTFYFENRIFHIQKITPGIVGSSYHSYFVVAEARS